MAIRILTYSIHRLFVLCVLHSISLCSFVPPMIDFDQSLQIRTHERPFPGRIAQLAFDYITKPAPYTALLDHLRALYNKHKSAIAHPETQAKIPNIIHLIWLGNDMPAHYLRYQETWVRMHPSWTIILWTDRIGRNPSLMQSAAHYQERHINSFGPLINQKFFDAAPNYAEKSDILRYEILHAMGGLYVDCDVECFNPVDILHRCFTFYAGIEPMECGRLVGNALIAACPGHPIMKRCIESITSSHDLAWINQRFGMGMATVCATGPMVLSQSVYTMSDQPGYTDIVLPTSYFYPCGLLRPAQPIRPESFAAHYWSINWIWERK